MRRSTSMTNMATVPHIVSKNQTRGPKVLFFLYILTIYFKIYAIKLKKGDFLMLEVKIYCIKSHQYYQASYDVVVNVLEEYNLEYNITRITKSDLISHRNIPSMPYIVINNVVVNSKSCPTANDIKMFLIRTKLI